MNPGAGDHAVAAGPRGLAATPRKAQALVVSGFLGSGKTTLVRHLLEQGRHEGFRTAVVSNEFGELGIDEALLASSEGDFVELAGGCVCCRLSDDLLRTLQALWERAEPDRVIVETSGLALPYDTLLNFWRDPVQAWAVDAVSAVVVSAEQVAAGRELDATFEDQVSAADLLVLSKLDLVNASQARVVRERLQAMAPGVPILESSFGRVEPGVFFPPEPGSRGAEAPPAPGRPAHDRGDPHDPEQGREQAQADGHGHGGGHAHAHDRYRSEELFFAPGLPAAEVQRCLQERAALRAKGFVQAAEGPCVVQGVAGRIEVTAADTPPPPALLGRVVVIERIPDAPEEPPAAAIPRGAVPDAHRPDPKEEPR